MQQPSRDCPLCPRLQEFREVNQQKFPDFFNGAVPSFGSLEAEILVIGLAPGLKGANWSGRPFTGDYAGDILYPALLEHGLARGRYGATAEDGLELMGARITNAARCVPPENKPTTQEVATCNAFLRSEIETMPNLRALIVLGGISHKATLKALGYKQSAFAFKHAAQYALEQPKPLQLFCTYHCSRYNINTRRLTYEMFAEVIGMASASLR